MGRLGNDREIEIDRSRGDDEKKLRNRDVQLGGRRDEQTRTDISAKRRALLGKVTENNMAKKERTSCGRTLSTVSTSFENRFRMRPCGVVSNDAIGHLRTYVSKASCIAFAASNAPSAKVSEPIN